MDILDFGSSVRDDIAGAVEAIARYLENYPLPPSCFTVPMKRGDVENAQPDSPSPETGTGNINPKAQ